MEERERERESCTAPSCFEAQACRDSHLAGKQGKPLAKGGDIHVIDQVASSHKGEEVDIKGLEECVGCWSSESEGGGSQKVASKRLVI